MKTKRIKLAALLLLLATLNSQLSIVLAQGGLTPPGAPAPTMKSLAQIEPRTDVAKLAGDSSDLFLITQPGSYYLTTNVVGVASKHGIGIASGNVTLDLNGFSVLGVLGSLRGIFVTGTYTNITVRNGIVSGWGYIGVDAYSFNPRNVVIENLTVSANAVDGIDTDAASVVRNCLCLTNGSTGISCHGGLVCGCVCRDCAFGIIAISSVVRDCEVFSSSYYGIQSVSCTVSGCWVQNSGKSGIYVSGPGSQIIGNTCYSNNLSGSAFDAGIYISSANTRVDGNHVIGSGYAGIQVPNAVGNTNSIVIRNTVSGNGANNYVVFGNNAFGPLISNFGTITNSNPWANFSY